MAASARDLAMIIHAHPTLTETIGEAAETIYGTATHLMRPLVFHGLAGPFASEESHE